MVSGLTFVLCFSRNLAQLTDLNRVASKTGIFAGRARIDQAVGLYYRKET